MSEHSGEELFDSLKQKLPKEFHTDCLIASYNNVLPRNDVRALDDLLAEIESGKLDKTVQIYKRRRTYPTSAFDLNDKNATDFSRAEAAFLRMVHLGREKSLPFAGASTDEIKKLIVRIDFIENKEMEEKFQRKKKEFGEKNIPNEEKLMFHGTHPSQISNILAENFRLDAHPVAKKKQEYYGKGIYLSEYPAVSLAFGQILTCRVLPGIVETKVDRAEPLEDSEIGAGFNSRRIVGKHWGDSIDDFSIIHIVKEVQQVLPYCVVYLGQNPKPADSIPMKSAAASQGQKRPRSPSPPKTNRPIPPRIRTKVFVIDRLKTFGAIPLKTFGPIPHKTNGASPTKTFGPRSKNVKSKDLIGCEKFGNLTMQRSHICAACNDKEFDFIFKVNGCRHKIHAVCADAVLLRQPSDDFFECPVCNKVQGTKVGNQPDGEMQSYVEKFHLPGFPKVFTIVIEYDFSPGVQGPKHPSPGSPYACEGFPRKAYLPNDKVGKNVLKLLKIAFDRRLIFTIGTSATTGRKDSLIWNGIHHKTEKGPSNSLHSYPDDKYLDNVIDELKKLGVS